MVSGRLPLAALSWLRIPISYGPWLHQLFRQLPTLIFVDECNSELLRELTLERQLAIQLVVACKITMIDS